MSQSHDQAHYLAAFRVGLRVRAGGLSGYISGNNPEQGGCHVDFDGQDDPMFFAYSELEVLPETPESGGLDPELPDTLSAMILTVFTHAGGAGKTSIVLNVAHRLGELGYRVLAIDLDPQANLSDWLGVEDADLSETVYGVALNNDPLPQPRRVHGVDLIPSHIDMAIVEGGLRDSISGIMRLRKALEAKRAEYDVVLIDSPPSLGKLAGFGALAADALIVPLPTRKKGINALYGINRIMPEYQELRPELRIALYVPTMYGLSRAKDKQLYGELQKLGFGPMTTPVPQRDAKWNEATEEGKPVIMVAPKSPVAEDVRRLTHEIITLLGLPRPEAQA